MKFEKYIFVICLTIFCIVISCKKKEDASVGKFHDIVDKELYLYDLAQKKYTRVTQSPQIKETRYQFTADNKQIVFNTNSGLFKINIDGTDQTQIATGNYERTLSPDGKYFAYTENGKLFLMDFDGGNIRQISNDSVGVVQLQWSRNSKKIAYFKLNRHKSYSYYVSADGISIIDLQGNVENLKIDGTFYNIYPIQESFDSKYIGYVKDNENDLQVSNTDFYIYDLIHHKERKINTTLDEVVFSPTRPEMVSYRRYGNYFDAYWALSDMSGVGRYLLQTNVQMFGFSFSPDGNKLVFLEDSKVAFMDRTGANLTRIEELDYCGGLPIWSNDGKYVLVYIDFGQYF